MSDLFINTFNEVRTCVFKDDEFEVRDNGAILRRRGASGRHRKLDNYWTFGKKNERTGYALFGSDGVHRIVATAFHGSPPTSQHIVDHIDTNRMNNRPENLRWITKLENILLNPITCKRIIEAYGSIEEFFSDPQKPKIKPLPGQFDWMRTVSEAEAAASKEKLEKWAGSAKSSAGGGLGEWVFEHRTQVAPPKLPEITKSLDENALQANWKTPSHFPLCPEKGSGESLQDYASKLGFGVTFSENEYGKSIVADGRLDRRSNCAVVVCFIENAPLFSWGISTIYEYDGKFIHEHWKTYISLIEAMEIYAAAVGDRFRPTDFDPDFRPSFQ